MSDHDTSGVREGAREFAFALRFTPRISAFLQAQEAVQRDSQAQQIIRRFSELRERYAAKTATRADYNEIVALQQKIQRHPLIRKYVDAQQEAIEFVQTVNATISQVLGLDFGATAGAAKRTC